VLLVTLRTVPVSVKPVVPDIFRVNDSPTDKPWLLEHVTVITPEARAIPDTGADVALLAIVIGWPTVRLCGIKPVVTVAIPLDIEMFVICV
jgi:hypothetical protein